ncbi:hypothetical protein BJV74DRAFT_189022 [Russula compacta]|nr:hypothetical protein BJV74DRAFT_189022 [Russula compacta]
MKKSTDLILQNNLNTFRIYTRRLANPTDERFFLTTAGKVTTFLSNAKAYYAEAQLPIIESLEVACRSLQNVAPSVFSNPGSLDRSVIPADKAPLFDAFDKLTNSVTPYVSLFTDESLRNRLISFLSSIGVSLPPESTNTTSPNTLVQLSATPPTGHQADPTASQVHGDSLAGNAPSDPVVMISGLPPTVKGPTASDQLVTPLPISSPPPVEVKGSDGGLVVQSTPSRILQPPVSGSFGRPPSPKTPVSGDVVKPARVEPSPSSCPPTSSLATSSASPSLHHQPSSLVSVPPVAPLSFQEIPVTPSVMPPSVQVSQNVPPSRVQPAVQTPSTSVVSPSPDQQKPKPLPRRQSSGLDFLQLDLQVAREKKLRAARAAGVQKSGSTAQAPPEPAPSISTKVVLAAETAPLTSPTTSDSMQSTPVATTSMSAGPAATLVHRDLRQGTSRNGTSRRLRITDRAPVPPPEPGSSGAPIVIDEDEPMPMSADEPAIIDAPTPAPQKEEETVTTLDPQGDTRGDHKLQPEQGGMAISEQLPPQNVSVLQGVSHPFVSERDPPATGISGANIIATQGPSAPTSGPSSSFATPLHATPASDPSELPASECDKPAGVQLKQATDDKEQGKTREDSVENLDLSSVDSVSSATIEPSSDVMAATKNKDAETIAPAPATVATESSPAQVASIEPDLQSNPAEPHRSGEHVPTISVAEASLAIGKHPRSPTPANGDIGRVFARKLSNAEKERALPSRPDSTSRTEPRSTTEMFSDMDISHSVSPPPIVVLGTRTVGSSSDSRSVSPTSGKRPSDAGTELVKAEEIEDEMVDELAPLFGKEMRVICMDRAYDVPGEFIFDFNLSHADWNRVSQWTRAPENLDLDISRARCITLACYSMKELEPYATQEGLAREKWFENVKPIPWANLPRNLWALINDRITVVFPPYLVCPVSAPFHIFIPV